MVSGKKVKFLAYETTQILALCVPTIVVAERFATIMKTKGSSPDFKTFQVILACSVAYVACVLCVIWVPAKVLMFKKRILSEVMGWHPALVMHLIFTTLPCFGFIIAGFQVQKGSSQIKDFSDLPVSLVITCLIFVSVIEDLRKWQLTGKIVGNSSDTTGGPVLTNIEYIPTVSEQQSKADKENPTTASVTENQCAPPVAQRRLNQVQNVLQSNSSSVVSECNTPDQNIPAALNVLTVKDHRAELFVTGISSWLDTIEMVRVGGLHSVATTGWVYPIYIFSYLSLLRIALVSSNPFLPFLTVILQDFPFFIIRVSLIGVQGFVTPVLYPLKNIIVTITFIYFNYVTKCKTLSRLEQF
ncbi:transmembrane protein 236-like [Pristis pectinata]|uniref:transmembrane protein 236-like n=1 Tax=Pristis pectinata TaxID=685728 RepID=UPI00223E54F1|nr:transmembrane protein 236-like [Pristis pectinata]